MIRPAVAILAVWLAAAGTPNHWFRIIADCQAQQHRLDTEDRRFLAYMANVMVLDDWPGPTASQERWLLDIKRRLTK